MITRSFGSQKEIKWSSKTKPAGSWKKGVYAYNEFWIPKRQQKKPQNTNSLGLQKGGLNDHRFLDFIKNAKRSRNETVDRELEGKAWRDLADQCIVQYLLYCTVPLMEPSRGTGLSTLLW